MDNAILLKLENYGVEAVCCKKRITFIIVRDFLSNIGHLKQLSLRHML
jgi:hypothetical protein